MTTMDKQCAIDVKKHALEAVVELNHALEACEDRCSAEEYERIRRGIGISIGTIQVEVLDTIYAAFPDLSDVN